MEYVISYSNGRESRVSTLEAARAELAAEYPDLYLWDDGEERILAWADEDSSEDDDGTYAVASIRRQTTITRKVIRDLREAAGASGDLEQVAACDRALAGDDDAWAQCESARAQ